ncbi:MAG: 6-bladed beta-propeller [Magnetococcus sp. DMHC-6]
MALVFLAGCVTTQTDELTNGEIYWPRPPQLPRFAWQSVIHKANDIEIKEPEQKDFLNISDEHIDKDVFIKPVRVAAFGGRIFVTDTMAKLVHVFDAVRRRYYQFGARFEGTLGQPLGIAVDRQGMVYVADGTKKVVVVFDQLGLWSKFIGNASLLKHPVAVALSPTGDRIYVIDNDGTGTSTHRMVIFDQEGKMVGQPIGQRGKEEGEFNMPTDLCVGSDGRVYVLDAGNFRVQIFDRDGKFLAKWGRLGRGIGQFARPRAIAIDKDNLIYVVDGAFANLQIFNDQGQLLLPIGEGSSTDGPATFASPSGVTVDEAGYVYIVDQWLRKVEILRKLTETEGKLVLNGQDLPPLRAMVP